MTLLRRLLRALPLLVISPLLFTVPVLACALTDLCWRVAGRRRRAVPPDTQPCTDAVSVVIPNWNGRDLLEKHLLSVVDAVRAHGHPDNEIIVVDNASSDGSARFLHANFPTDLVKVLTLQRNLGFGGGSNAGFRAAKNDIVVLLNNDMRVAPDFLPPLLAAFSDEKVFSVSCQIFFSDPHKLREETGLTQSWWTAGWLRVRHRIDEAIQTLYPCAYGGGGSSAFDRRKFLALGGFDDLLRPFYLEDTDLGYMAWKRGWKVLYQPNSHVWHEHRGTIGKTFSKAYIDSVLEKNFLLFTWKNIHEWRRLLEHFFFAAAGALVSVVFGESLERASLRGFGRACLQLPRLVASRWRALDLAQVSDTEAFRRPLGGYFRDRFDVLPQRIEKPSVLFVSPYPICPPVHGGAVFMLQTAQALAQLAVLHLIVLLDRPQQEADHSELAAQARSASFLARMPGRPKGLGSIEPNAIREFSNQDLEWLIHRTIYLNTIDVVQLEYLPMAQYRGEYRQLACFLFEHDIYFQSIARQLRGMEGLIKKATAAFEYLRALRYELQTLPKLDRVQVCSPANKKYLLEFLPDMRDRLDACQRAGITPSIYEFRPDGREPDTMLFLGSFRHAPNMEALQWFTKMVMPHVLARRPGARLVLVGSDPPPRHSLPDYGAALEFRGFVEDVGEPLRRYSVFVCPILSGSGVRVKLLEAFAAGIPVVSTRIGAEGLADGDRSVCLLADEPAEFAERVLELLADPTKREELARRARAEVEARWDLQAATLRLVDTYRAEVERKRGAYLAEGKPPMQ